MSIVRVDKTKNYTIMSNYHLQDDKLSFKAKGLMSWMLSLPDNWDFTVAGISMCCKEGKDAINGALKELESSGYLIRTKTREGGKFSVDYELNEKPSKADRSGKTATEKPQQISTNKPITKKQKNKKELNEYRNGFLSENSTSERNTKDLDTTIINRQVLKVCREKGVSDDVAYACFSVIEYYVDQYKRIFSKDHKVITNNAMTGVLERLLSGIDDILDPLDTYDLKDGFKTQIDLYKKMINQHFKTEYNGKVDYNISHFMSEGILRHRFYEVCY